MYVCLLSFYSKIIKLILMKFADQLQYLNNYLSKDVVRLLTARSFDYNYHHLNIMRVQPNVQHSEVFCTWLSACILNSYILLTYIILIHTFYLKMYISTKQCKYIKFKKNIFFCCFQIDKAIVSGENKYFIYNKYNNIRTTVLLFYFVLS